MEGSVGGEGGVLHSEVDCWYRVGALVDVGDSLHGA